MPPKGKRGLTFTLEEIEDLLGLIDEVAPIGPMFVLLSAFFIKLCRLLMGQPGDPMTSEQPNIDLAKVI
jgi:hypothetical protein